MKAGRYTAAEQVWERPYVPMGNPVIPVSRPANIPSRICKRGHTRTPSLGVLVKGNVLSSHIRVLSNVPSGRQTANAGYRPIEQRRTFSPEEFFAGTVMKGGVRPVMNAFGNFVRSGVPTTNTITNGNVNNGFGGTFDFVRLGTANNTPQLHIVRKSGNSKFVGVKPEIGQKEGKHVGVLLGMVKPNLNGKPIKHIKRGSVNYVDAWGRASQEQKRAEVNWGVTGKRYSPTAKYLHMKKIIMFETKETTAEKVVSADQQKSEDTFTLFTDSFRKKLQADDAENESLLEGNIIVPASKSVIPKEESIHDRLRFIDKVRQISPIRDECEEVDGPPRSTTTCSFNEFKGSGLSESKSVEKILGYFDNSIK